MLIKYGLIGYPLGHTFSPKYFTKKFAELNLNDHEYKAYPIASIHGLDELMKGHIVGLNVTAPYKELVIPYLDDISEEADQIGAVNTIKIEDGKKSGFNTDIYGFESSLKPLLKDDFTYKALILGTGGASKSVKFVLDRLNIPYQLVSRSNGDLNYKELDDAIIADHKLIINTTPIGTAPNYKQKPAVPMDSIGEDHLVYDLIYNPAKTKFLQLASKNGATTKNGLEMLELQADKSWEIWKS